MLEGRPVLVRVDLGDVVETLVTLSKWITAASRLVSLEAGNGSLATPEGFRARDAGTPG
jgi:hypothetical protein